jgi:hypothetical protein
MEWFVLGEIRYLPHPNYWNSRALPSEQTFFAVYLPFPTTIPCPGARSMFRPTTAFAHQISVRLHGFHFPAKRPPKRQWNLVGHVEAVKEGSVQRTVLKISLGRFDTVL